MQFWDHNAKECLFIILIVLTRNWKIESSLMTRMRLPCQVYVLLFIQRRHRISGNYLNITERHLSSFEE